MIHSRYSQKICTFAPEMQFMSQPRYKPRTQRDDWHYRIMDSLRDLTGRYSMRFI